MTDPSGYTTIYVTKTLMYIMPVSKKSDTKASRLNATSM